MPTDADAAPPDAPRLIAVGPFPTQDLAALAQIAPMVSAAGSAEIAGLPADLRAGITAAATTAFAPFGAAAFDALPGLRVVANFGVGFDNVDMDAAAARGVRVSNTPDVLTDDVADLAVAMLLALTRQVARGDAYVRDGAWIRDGPMALTRTLTGRKVGLLGLGRIGRAIADRLVPFRVSLHYTARAPKDTSGWTFHPDPVALAHAVDDLIVATTGGPQTEGIVSPAVIDALGPDGQIVNIARGSCVDEPALIEALQEGRLRGAALDVFAREPEVDPRLRALPAVLLQPHQGSATRETRAAMAALQRENLTAHFAGAPLVTPVN